jgi:hypothetical protein
LAPEKTVPGLHQSQLSMHRQKLLENFMDWTKVRSAAVLGHEFVASAVKTRLTRLEWCWRHMKKLCSIWRDQISIYFHISISTVNLD